MGYGNIKRLITKETKAISMEGIPEPSRRRKGYGGILIDSIEGVRFAYTTTSLPVPKDAMPEVENVVDLDQEPQIEPPFDIEE